MKLIDLTHMLTPQVPTWNGNCGFHIEVVKNYGNGDEVRFRNNTLSFEAGIGTHMDAPAHCIPDAVAIGDLSLTDLISPGVMIDVSLKAHESYTLTPLDVENFETQYNKIEKNSFVIIYTGWGKRCPNPEDYRNKYRFPSISKEAAELLLERKIKGLGIDTLSPDRPESGYPVHQLLLGSGKYIIENIANAHLLPPKGFYVFALPLKIQGATESPIRLIALNLADKFKNVG